MSTQPSGEPVITAPNIFDGIYLVYDANNLSRPVGIVHSTWGAGIVGVENVVAEEQWLLFREPPPTDAVTTFKVPGGGIVEIRSAAAYPNRLPFHSPRQQSRSATVFVRIAYSQNKQSAEVFQAWKDSSDWLKTQEYAHFKVISVPPWPDNLPLPANAVGRVEQMDPLGSEMPAERRISFGETPVSTPTGTTQRIVTAYQSLNPGPLAFAVDQTSAALTYSQFQALVANNFENGQVSWVLAKGKLFQGMPTDKPTE